jgi:hypothetical protein
MMGPTQNEVLPHPEVAPARAGEVPDEVVSTAGGSAAPAAEPSADVFSHAPGQVAPAESEVGEVRGELQEAASDEVLIIDGERVYPSLYDNTWTTFAAIAFGFLIVGAVQTLVVKMYSTAKSEHDYLTRFVTSLVALIVSVYIADLLIAGPGTQLLSGNEKTLILTFVKDTALMIFSYYFGLKAQTPPSDPSTGE